MAINAYSTYASYLSNTDGIKRLQTSLVGLSQQLNSGLKSTDLTAYGVEATTLLDMRAEIKRREGYLDAITVANTDVKAYDQVFSRMETLAQDMQSAFTSVMSEPPTLQENTIEFEGDIGDIGDIYKVVVDGTLFTYATSGLEGSFDEVAGNLATQINGQLGLSATAAVKGERLIVTAKTPGTSYTVSARLDDIGNTNTVTAKLTRQGNASPIIYEVNNTLIELHSLLNEQIGDHYLFGGISNSADAPVVDLTRLPDPTGSANSTTNAITQQLAGGTIKQQIRISTDYLGTGQTEIFTINGNNFTFNGPLTAQQMAQQAAAAISGFVPFAGVLTVSDIDAQGFTITANVAGAAFTSTITGTDPTPSTIATVQPNVPIGATQQDIITLSGPVGIIGEIYSVTITDPLTNPQPVTVSYRTTGNEKDLDEIAAALKAKIDAYQPPFTNITTSVPGGNRLILSSSFPFTSHSGVQNMATVTTTQRTVVAVAQQDEVRFNGPFDAGDTYVINFTAPVAGPFPVVVVANDTEVEIAQKFVSLINNSAFGVTAAIKNGRLTLTSNTPGTPFTYTANLTVDVGQVSAAPVSTNTVANIPPGPLPQIDRVQLTGPVGRKGDVYELTVAGRTVRYTTTGTEMNMDEIALALVGQVTISVPPIPATAILGPAGSGSFTLTSTTPGQLLNTKTAVAKTQTIYYPDAPDYSSRQEALDSANTWTRGKLTIADQLTIRYTFSAHEIPFQRLQMALRIAHSAVSDATNYSSKLEDSRSLMREALIGLRGLHGDNSVIDTLMSATTLSHQTSINMTRGQSNRIELVDPNEVAIKVQSAQTQLQAIFAVTGTTNRLSLVNFLA